MPSGVASMSFTPTEPTPPEPLLLWRPDTSMPMNAWSITPLVWSTRRQAHVLLAAGDGEEPAEQQSSAGLGDRVDHAVGGRRLEPGDRRTVVDPEEGQVAGRRPAHVGEGARDVDGAGDGALEDVLDITVQDRVERGASAPVVASKAAICVRESPPRPWA